MKFEKGMCFVRKKVSMYAESGIAERMPYLWPGVEMEIVDDKSPVYCVLVKGNYCDVHETILEIMVASGEIELTLGYKMAEIMKEVLK